jgi:hypothetical protein
VEDTVVDLRPKTNWVAMIGMALAVGGAVWGGTNYLHSRADVNEVKEVRRDAFQTRLDQETMKGDIKAINIRIEEGFKGLNGKVDAMIPPRRR